MKNFRSLEITSRIGCKNMCKYCPQKLLISNYPKNPKYNIMSFDTFKRCLKKVPKNVRIDFSGMAEPWLNKNCTRMILYAYKHGFKRIAVYTTCVGMTMIDVRKIENIPFEIFCIHLADAGDNTKIKVDNQYLKVLKMIKKSKIKKIQFMAMGKVHHKLRPLFTNVSENLQMTTRGGNIKFLPQVFKLGHITCNWPQGLQHNILLPNGDILLCCTDYGMTRVLGNLLKDSYGDLFKGKEFKNILKLLKNENKGDIICRHCEYSINYIRESLLHTVQRKNIIKPMYISIAVCTCNRADILKETLERLLDHLKHLRAIDKYELVIIDNNSQDNTKETVIKLKRKHKSIKIKYFFEQKQGIAFARNLALKKYKGDIIAFLDDDLLVNKHWIVEVKKAIKLFPEAAVIGGRVLPRQPLSKLCKEKWFTDLYKHDYRIDLITPTDKGNQIKYLRQDNFLGGANLIIQRKYLKRIGKFQTIFGNQHRFFRVFGGEDYDFIQRAIDKSFLVVYYPKILVFHKIYTYKFRKSYFRWRYFENGKEGAFFDLLHKRDIKNNIVRMILNIQLDLRRTISQYLLKRPQNFFYELNLFYNLGYILASAFGFHYKAKK